jgi:hypothetical protein
MPTPIYPLYKLLHFAHACTEFYLSRGHRWCVECNHIHPSEYEAVLDEWKASTSTKPPQTPPTKGTPPPTPTHKGRAA